MLQRILISTWTHPKKKADITTNPIPNLNKKSADKLSPKICIVLLVDNVKLETDSLNIKDGFEIIKTPKNYLLTEFIL